MIRNQRSQLRRSLKVLRKEGFRHVFILETQPEVDAAVIERVPLWTDRTNEHGPFDIIGDIHGCADELEQLLTKLGHAKTEVAGHEPGWSNIAYVHPNGRKAVFVGDLVDRGLRILDTLSIVRNMVRFGSALCVPGNHDVKLLKKLQDRDVGITHGLAQSLAEIDAWPEDVRAPFAQSLAEFLDSLVSHYVLDDGKLVVAHARARNITRWPRSIATRSPRSPSRRSVVQAEIAPCRFQYAHGQARRSCGLGETAGRASVRNGVSICLQRPLQRTLLADRLAPPIPLQELLGPLRQHPADFPALALHPWDHGRVVSGRLMPHPGDDGGFGSLFDGDALPPCDRAAPHGRCMGGDGLRQPVGEIGVCVVECQERHYRPVEVLDVLGLDLLTASGVRFLLLGEPFGGSLGFELATNP